MNPNVRPPFKLTLPRLGSARFLALLALLNALLNLAPVSSRAAVIVWGAPATISADTDVSTNGATVFAYTWGTGSTVNGIAFAATSVGNGAVGSLSVSGLGQANSSAFTSASNPFNALNPAYKNILVGGDYVVAATTATLTLNNLTVGRNYQVQVWANDPRGSIEFRTQTISSSGGSSQTITICPNVAGSPGQQVMGSFTADSASQAFTLVRAAGSVAQIAALQLRDLSPPATATPAFNPPAGAYLGQRTVAISSEPGSTVFYTTDGSDPNSASAHGPLAGGAASVQLPAPAAMTIKAYATNSAKADSSIASAAYTTVTNFSGTTIFTGPHRQGPNKDGVVQAQWGVEQTMLYEDGIFKSWYHGAPDSGGDYWNNPVIRYATSPDGANWTDQGVCLGNTPYFRACPFTYHLTNATAAGEPAGYYMPVGRNGQFGFDLFYSTNGLPGTWQWLNNSNLIINLGSAGTWDQYRSGNICIWYEASQWQVMYEAADVPPAQTGCGSQWFSWRVGRAYGPSLTNLTKYPLNPVIYNSTFPCGAETAAGGTEVHKVGNTYYASIHETDPLSYHHLTPSSCSLYKSTNLNSWTRVGWLARIWVNKSSDAQVADGSFVSVNGKTYYWYEDQPDQSTLLPSLGLMTWDMPFEELVNHPEYFEDPALEGWVAEPGYDEVPTGTGNFPSTYFRKVSAPISPNCMVFVADASHQVRVRKPVGLTDNTFAFSARTEQTNRKFIPLRLDADANNTVLAGAWFDTDGMIKYYSGAGIATAQPYTAAAIYGFAYQCNSNGYALTINGSLIASNIPYASSYAPPAYYKIEQSSGSTGYVGVPMALNTNKTRWTGAVSGDWDVTTPNWTNGNGTNVYSEGDTVQFDDSAAGASPVAVTVTAPSVSPDTIVLSNSAKDYSIGGNPISGSGGLTKSGTGTLTLSSPNTYSGGTTLNGGTVSFGTGALGTAGTVTFAGNATLQWYGTNTQDLSSRLSIAGGVTAAFDTLTNTVTFAAGIGAGGAGALTKAGPGTLILSGANTFTGALTVSGGTLLLGTPGGTVYSYSGGGIAINNGSTLAISGGRYNFNGTTFTFAGAGGGTLLATAQSQGGLVFMGTNSFITTGGAQNFIAGTQSGANNNYGLNLNSKTAVFNVARGTAPDADLLVSATLWNTGNLLKLGSGIMALSASNTLAGSTAVNGGTLRVNGSLPAGNAVTVNSNATLGGTGTVAGSVTLNGWIAPGPGLATLNTGPQSWNSGGGYLCELNATNASGCDLLNIAGALNLQATPAAPFILKPVSLTAGNTPGPLAGFNKFASGSWVIATASAGISNFATNKFLVDTSAFANDITGGRFVVDLSGNSLLLKYVAAPLVYPAFTGVTALAGGAIQLSSTGGAVQAYVLLGTSNLAPANWIALATNVADTNGAFQFTDLQVTNGPQRFYRTTSP
jgi:autotransporter-associated beta strand protein